MEEIKVTIDGEGNVKVTVFGPVVNLASRLEGMTRLLGSSILLDRTTHDELKSQTDKPVPTRNFGKFQPFGMSSQIDVFELVTQLDPVAIKEFESGLELFQAGDWKAAQAKFRKLPEADSGKRFFEDFIDAMVKPPDDWNGVVEMQSK